MCVSCMERKINVCVLKSIRPGWTLESSVAQAALGYFGHVVREEREMENDGMLEEMSWRRSRGRQITRWLNNVNNITGPSVDSII